MIDLHTPDSQGPSDHGLLLSTTTGWEAYIQHKQVLYQWDTHDHIVLDATQPDLWDKHRHALRSDVRLCALSRPDLTDARQRALIKMTLLSGFSCFLIDGDPCLRWLPELGCTPLAGFPDIHHLRLTDVPYGIEDILDPARISAHQRLAWRARDAASCPQNGRTTLPE